MAKLWKAIELINSKLKSLELINSKVESPAKKVSEKFNQDVALTRENESLKQKLHEAELETQRLKEANNSLITAFRLMSINSSKVQNASQTAIPKGGCTSKQPVIPDSGNTAQLSHNPSWHDSPTVKSSINSQLEDYRQHQKLKYQQKKISQQKTTQSDAQAELSNPQLEDYRLQLQRKHQHTKQKKKKKKKSIFLIHLRLQFNLKILQNLKNRQKRDNLLHPYRLMTAMINDLYKLYCWGFNNSTGPGLEPFDREPTCVH